MTQQRFRQIASSIAATASFAPDELGAPGAPGTIVVVAELPNETRSDQARLADTSPRPFVVDVLLTTSVTIPQDFNMGFSAEDGSSFVKGPIGTTAFRIDTRDGAFEVQLNSRQETALITVSLEAADSIMARDRAHDRMAPFLDHLSFIANTPVLTGLTRIIDEKNQTTTLDLLGPEQAMMLDSGQRQLSPELAPVYALYREFKNAGSAFYRLLCLFKILEGVYGVLRPACRERAKALGIRLEIPKETVPDHPEIAIGLKRHVGRPVKEFFDRVVQKEFRDVVAHFLVRDNSALQLGSAAERHRFAEMAFVCDLCARLVIENQEACYRRLQAAAPPP